MRRLSAFLCMIPLLTATADLGEDSRDVGVGDTQQAAVREALLSLGGPYATELADSMGPDGQR